MHGQGGTAVTALLVQGYAHQIRLIWRSGKTGALSLKMSQLILAIPPPA